MVSKKKKQKIKFKNEGQKGLKRCKTCSTLLNPFSNSDYCSDKCENADKTTKEVILGE